jgi:hypothetical protein
MPVATTAIGGLYLETHSIVVTLIGASTVGLLTYLALGQAQDRVRTIGRPETGASSPDPAVDLIASPPIPATCHLPGSAQ